MQRIPAREILPLLRDAFGEWTSDKSPRLAAALSYYALFSVIPLLLISIAIAGFAFGEEAARGQILETVRGVVGQTASRGIEQLILNAKKAQHSGVVATLVGFAMLLFGASGVFNQLKDSLNAIWEVPPRSGGGVFRLIRERFLSFAMVLAVGFLLLVSLVISAALAAVGKYVSSRLPGGEALWQFVNLALSVVVITFLFALIFRYVPDTRIPWRDVWMGALFTSLLVTLGKFLIGLYLGKSTLASAYGAAGSVVVILVWIYYSSLLVFFGAEFTEVYARRRREGEAAPRRRSHREELLARARTEALPHRLATEPAERRGGRVVPLVTGCAGLVVGILIGVLSALIGVAVTAFRSVAKKLTK